VHGRARPLTLALAAAALASAGCAEVRGTAANPAVTKLELVGAREFDPGEIVERLATQPSEGPLPIPILGPLLHQLALELELPPDAPPARVPIVGPVVRSFRLAAGGVDVRTLDEDALTVDRRRIEAWYRERGYYGARVQDVTVTPDGEGRVEVKLTVDEGQPTRVANVEVRGLEAAPEAAAALGKLALRPGEVFTVAAYDAARAQLEQTLKQTGFALGAVTQSARVVPEDLSATVVYEVKPGPRLRFGALFVAGTATVRRDLIRELATIEIRSGEWYDERKLARAQGRVFDLGVFGGVRVTRGEPDLGRGTVPIVVAVREAPFRTVRLGPGLNFDSTRWDVSGQAGWTHRNFYGDLRRLSLDLRAGYAWIPTPFAVDESGVVGLARVEFAQPVVAWGRVDAAARFEVERGIEASYDFWAERLQLSAPVRLGPRWSFVPSYNFEVYQISHAPEFAADEDSTIDSCNLNQNATDQSGVCLLTYFEQRLAWDGRDAPVNPRRGLYVALALQQGFRVIDSGYRYLRFFPEVRGYLPFGASMVLAARARFGGLVPLGETVPPPPVALYYGGGPSSTRGYSNRQYAPLKFEDHDWVPLGANGLADASIELRFALSGSWGGAVFVDGAGVSYFSNSETEFLKALDLTNTVHSAQAAVGVGLRYATPFGPLRLDVGMRIPTEWGPGVNFHHRFPPAPWTPNHRETIAAVHLLLGEAF
jgi:translocation and assembly module TamA